VALEANVGVTGLEPNGIGACSGFGIRGFFVTEKALLLQQVAAVIDLIMRVLLFEILLYMAGKAEILHPVIGAAPQKTGIQYLHGWLFMHLVPRFMA
jgi:hypothetical protein